MSGLDVNVGGILMKNPVMVSSGTFGYGEEYAPFINLEELGAIVVKGITLKPTLGNPPPRIVETPSGLLNAVGLQNCGLECFIDEKLPALRKLRTPVIVNICGEEVEDYIEIAKTLSEVEGVAGIELNISCPNVARGGMQFGVDPSLAWELVRRVRKITPLPLLAKLTPNTTHIVEVAKSCVSAGCNGISLVNTFLGMAVDVKTRKPKLPTITGGLSGPAIKPIALRMVWEVAREISTPVVGQGGIMNTSDALEFIIAGATAISVGTANFVNPFVSIEIIEGLRKYLIENEIPHIKKLIGTLRV
jgi:dihydroorotate dehydrogenase (NAD+) catalytic subunit